MRAAVAALALSVIVLGSSPAAHKGVTSKHTYNADVFPIFASRCGQCHVAGGVGPMSLVTYQDAFPWAESLRTELLNLGELEADDYIREAHRSLTASELDVVLDEQMMRLSDVMKLQPGSRIVLNTNIGAPVLVRCGAVPLFEGRVGRRKSRVAVRIERDVPRIQQS